MRDTDESWFLMGMNKLIKGQSVQDAIDLIASYLTVSCKMNKIEEAQFSIMLSKMMKHYREFKVPDEVD